MVIEADTSMKIRGLGPGVRDMGILKAVTVSQSTLFSLPVIVEH